MMAALWSSGFRPFFLLGAAYGPLVVLISTPAAGLFGAAAPVFWHGHEMLFGFAVAFICGFVLTALPSWAGTPEIKGRPLQLLVILWIAARAGTYLAPPALGAALDLLPLVVLAALVLPGLVRVLKKRYLALLPILLCLALTDLFYYVAVGNGDIVAAERALLLAVNVLTVLFAAISGLLTPAFTETALREAGEPVTIPPLPAIEFAAIAGTVLFAAADWLAAPRMINGVIALIAAAMNLLRLARWHARKIWRMPMIVAMHAACAWLVVAMLLRAGADLSGAPPRSAWIHAFTVGALSMMMLALLNRVALRHTGRTPALSALAQAGLAIMFVAGLARVGASLFEAGAAWIAASAWLWAISFVLFLCTDGPKLWRPSLPRAQAGTVALFKE